MPQWLPLTCCDKVCVLVTVCIAQSTILIGKRNQASHERERTHAKPCSMAWVGLIKLKSATL